MELWVMYLNGVPSGAAMGKTEDEVITQMRAFMLASGEKESKKLEAKSWKAAPIDDVVRAGLGTLVTQTLMMQGMAMAAQQKGGRIIQ